MTSALKTLIFRALDTAVDENGYDELLTNRPEAVAVDLASYDAEIEASKDWQHVQELVPVVREWQTLRRAMVLAL